MNLNYYYLFEAAHAVMGPARAATDMLRLYYKNPVNPLSHTLMGRNIAAACEMFERTTRRYGKPSFDLETTTIDGREVAVRENIVWSRPFCRLVHFQRATPVSMKRQPNLLIVAPMSGHYATLLRGTVEAFLPHYEVYVTDWTDARVVPLAEGRFDLDDYIDYLMAMLRELGSQTHVLAVCQPAVPVVAAIARMEAMQDPMVPRSMILMGGPIDTRKSPTEVNKLAEKRGIEWFKENCIAKVPFPHPGVLREVYPGFLQLSGFMAMNIDRHVEAHLEMFNNLVKGDGDSAEKHRDFYDEYMAVMDLTAEFYLQTVDTVFVKHALPKGEMMHRGERVDLGAVRRVGLMTVEGENDDISGVGQTKATHGLCVNLADDMQLYHLQRNVGHYGVFNGSRFRREIAPAIVAFTRELDERVQSGTARSRSGQNGAVAEPMPVVTKPAAAAMPAEPVAANTNAITPSKPAPDEVAASKPSTARVAKAKPKPAARTGAKQATAQEAATARKKAMKTTAASMPQSTPAAGKDNVPTTSASARVEAIKGSDASPKARPLIAAPLARRIPPAAAPAVAEPAPAVEASPAKAAPRRTMRQAGK